MSNDTDVVKVVSHSLYIVEGSFLMIGNALILIAVMKTKELRRKEFYIAAGLAAGDFLYGIGNFSAGIRRLVLVLEGQDTFKVTAWKCMQEFHNTFFILGGQFMAAMLLVVSYDRYVACTNLLVYMKLKTPYAIALVRNVGLYCVASLCVAVLSSYFLTDRVEKFGAVCFSNWAVPHWYAAYNLGHQAFCGFLSVIVLLVARKNLAKYANLFSNDAVKAAYQAKQKKVTVMIGIVVGCSFILYTIPMSIIFVMVSFGIQSSAFSRWAPVLWNLVILNSATNIFIYVYKNKEIRNAIFGMCFCVKAESSNTIHTVQIINQTASSASRAFVKPPAAAEDPKPHETAEG